MLKLLRDGDVINFIGHNLDGTNRMITVFEELDKLDITPLIHELSELFKKLVIFTREKRFLGIKSLLLILLVVLIAGTAFTIYTHQPKLKVIHQPVMSEGDVIIEGQGWKHVVLGATKDDIVNVLGKSDNRSVYHEAYFLDYYQQGIQINFDTTSNTVETIFFYHNQADSKQYAPFIKGTDRGINFSSTVDEVLQKYGKPQNDYKSNDNGMDKRRIVYPNIDFRFENGKMVRISIF